MAYCAKVAAMPVSEIEEQELEPAETILDIVAEDPQEQHVAEQMHPAAVQEHRGEDGIGIGCRRIGEARRDEGKLLDEPVARGELDQEHDHVERDEDDRDDRHGAALRVVVAQWKHGGGSPAKNEWRGS